ncbi:hypothetical protein [Paracoccus marcusii]
MACFGRPRPALRVAIGHRILDLAACEAQGLLDAGGTLPRRG